MAAEEAIPQLIEKLRERYARLARRHDKVNSDRRRAGAAALDPDFEEQATQRENDEVLDVLDAAETRELAAIEKALGRIEVGSFGVCDECGESVDPARLEALPAAALCLPCAERAEGQVAS